MTKQELIDRVAARLGGGEPAKKSELSKKTVALIVDAAFAELGTYFVKAKVSPRKAPRFTYPGFGTFTKKERAGRTGRDPRTGDAIVIPAKTTLGFAPGQDLKAALNRVGAASRMGPMRAQRGADVALKAGRRG